MANKMLIDATHPEETRVVVMHGNRVEEFDFESASRKQLRGNIYLAKVTRVEPSLQAAFVDYGGNRHGFLAFSEIHPDYYQIPVADRQALIEEESRAHRDAEEDDERRGGRRHQRHRRRGSERPRGEALQSEPVAAGEAAAAEDMGAQDLATEAAEARADDNGFAPHPEAAEHGAERQPETDGGETAESTPAEEAAAPQEQSAEAEMQDAAEEPGGETSEAAGIAEAPAAPAEDGEHGAEAEDGEDEEEVVESVGGDDSMEEPQERAPRYRRRQYKIQEVIKRRQVMLVQVVKEERGTKGAALTTYLSLAGRYSVLMPNTARGGGISRKITSADDRKRLKEIAEELEVPEGMGVILRTAGASRTKTEVKRDFEYLLRLWETVRDFTLKATAPTLVYEEGSLIKRSIRDLYHKDIEEIVVEGEAAYQEAKDFMRMLMPSHVKNVKLYRDVQPVFTRYGIESQLDAMFSPTVQLKSGGYIVINQAEALVAIDVNSGRATREHNIEDTALKTNSEAAAEIARQLRLRDLAGLIVIDFIDMDESRNNRSVERKLKESLKSDRARIQVGRISHFGLMEMSRQRIRTSVLESSTEVCPHCGGTGHVRSVGSVALQLLRSLEDLLVKGATHNLIVRTRSDVALYVLNHKRAHLRALEERFRILIAVNADESMTGQPPFTIDRGEQVMTLEQAKALVVAQPVSPPAPHEEEPEEEEIESAEAEGEIEAEGAEAQEAEQPQERGEGGRRRRRGRRGRGGRGREEAPPSFTHETVAEHAVAHEEDAEELPEGAEDEENGRHDAGAPRENGAEGERRRRRRGRRGGRRNRRGREDQEATGGEAGEFEAPEGEAPFEPQREEAPAPRIEPQRSAEFEPSPAPAAEEASARRRRSTVREPAPVFIQPVESGTSAPAPSAPPAERADEAPAEQPRRFGWWSKRG